MMTRILLSAAYLCGLASAASAAAGLNVLSPEEARQGFHSLFDGKTLQGWRGFKTEEPGAGWKIVEGAIVLTAPKSGDLVTRDAYEDFELVLEWRVAEGMNSGIIYRVGLDAAAPPQTGPEYQLLDNVKGKDNKVASHLAGSLYDLVAPSRDVCRPAGEWNEARIVVRGWKIQHWLNGARIVDADLGTPEGRAMIASSKFVRMPRFATLNKGHVALQDHGGEVSFRNIRIRKL